MASPPRRQHAHGRQQCPATTRQRFRPCTTLLRPDHHHNDVGCGGAASREYLSDATEAQLLPDVAITARREPHTSISACCIVLTLIKRRLARPVGSVGDRLPLLVPRLLEVFYCGICSRPASDASDTAWRYHSVMLACMSSRFGASGHCHAEKRAMRLCCEQLVHSMSLRVSLGPRTQHGRDSCCPKTLIDDFGPFL